MNSSLTFVHYNGEWENERKYAKYKVCGIVIEEECNFEQLQGILRETLNATSPMDCLSMKYQVHEEYPPISITDDRSLQFYKMLKKREPNYTKFPICTTLEKLNIQLSLRDADTDDAALNYSCNVQPMEIMPLETYCNADDESTRMINYAAQSSTTLATHIEEQMQKMGEKNIPAINQLTENTNIIIEPGQMFRDKMELKHTLSMYAIKHQFQYCVVKSCSKQYSVKCIDEHCPWSLKSSSIGDAPIFKIRRMTNVHTCALGKRMNEKRQATAEVVGSCIKDKFDNLKTHYTPADVIRDMQKQYGVELTYKSAWRARRKALEAVQGNPYDSYRLVPGYLHKLTELNPGSFVKLRKTSSNIFEYVFISLHASIKGWEHCRPIVIVDGTFLKAAYGGTLITASTQDAASHILLLAYGVVDSENNNAYEWFFMHLKEALSPREGLCIISDRHPSIINAISKVYPEASHCHCIYHLSKNIASKYKTNMEAVKEGFMAAALSYNQFDFNRHMSTIRKADPRVITFLEELGFEKWSRLHCEGNRFLTMTSNAAESINSAMKVAREMPITLLLECLRGMQQKWNVNNRAEAEGTFTKLAKLGHKMLTDNYKASMYLIVQKATDQIFKVSNGPKVFIVDLQKRTCSCNQFQMDELPCAHALCAIRGIQEEPEPFCSKYYFKETMMATYSEAVYPVDYETTATSSNGCEEELLPPPQKSQTGRRKQKRYISQWERGYKFKSKTNARF